MKNLEYDQFFSRIVPNQQTQLEPSLISIFSTLTVHITSFEALNERIFEFDLEPESGHIA